MNNTNQPAPTPDTDGAQFGTGRVSVDFARKLEIERDEARLQYERAGGFLKQACEKLKECEDELTRLKGQTKWQCKCGGTDCEGQRENEQLRKVADELFDALENLDMMTHMSYDFNADVLGITLEVGKALAAYNELKGTP